MLKTQTQWKELNYVRWIKVYSNIYLTDFSLQLKVLIIDGCDVFS